jgi:ABC-type multidrug transport system fused ATPase/permease subunit
MARSKSLLKTTRLLLEKQIIIFRVNKDLAHASIKRPVLMNSDKQNKSRSSWIGMLFYVLEGNKRKLFIALLMGLLSNAFISVTNPLALKYLFDEGIIKRDFRLFVALSFFFVLIFTLWRFGVYLYRLYVQKLKNTVFGNLCLKMLNKYFEIPYGEVIKRDQGYFLSRVYDEVIATAPAMIESSFSIFNTLVTLIVALIVVLFISWRAALTILVAVPLVYAVSRKYARKIKRESQLEREEEAKLRGVLGRAIGSYKIARTFNLQSKVYAKTNDQLHTFIDAFFLRFKTSGRYQTLSGMLMSYAETIAIIGAGYEMLAGRLSFGGYMGFMNAFWMVIGSVREIFNLVPELSRISGQIERLKEFEDTNSHPVNVRYSDAVKLEGVSFAYNGKNVLRDFHLEPKKGEKILIIGPNGSGKSTLAHLIAGLLDPTSGAATTFPLDRISALIFPFDFIPGTVKDNVSFAQSESTQKKFVALAHDFGLKEHLGKDTSELSAGLRKKLEIMMGLVKEADVYVFDEPLSGIDIDSKDKVISEILRYTEDKTLIIIMHGDKKFYRFFDRVINLAS